MSGIGVVLNPYSKSYKRNPAKLDHMAFIVGDKASYKPTDDIDDLYRVADEFKSRGIDILAISGGDGTIHCTLTAFLKVYGEKALPKIVLLRGGTLNTIAATMGVYGTTEHLLSSLLIRYHEDQSFTEKKLRLMNINGAYGCIWGCGVVFTFMENYYKNANLNPLIAAKTLTESIFSALCNGRVAREMFERFDAEVVVDGKKWAFANYNSLFAASIRQFGLNFNVFHHMLRQNENFHAYGISLPPRTLVPLLKRMYDGRATQSEHVLDDMTSHMLITLEKPIGYTIDGDMLGPVDHFEIKRGPELTVLV